MIHQHINKQTYKLATIMSTAQGSPERRPPTRQPPTRQPPTRRPPTRRPPERLESKEKHKLSGKIIKDYGGRKFDFEKKVRARFPRPKGRNPKGKVWDGENGGWIDPQVKYLRMKTNMYEELIIEALEYAQVVIDRCDSPNPMIHKSTVIQDFKKVLDLLGQHTGNISP